MPAQEFPKTGVDAQGRAFIVCGSAWGIGVNHHEDAQARDWAERLSRIEERVRRYVTDDA